MHHRAVLMRHQLQQGQGKLPIHSEPSGITVEAECTEVLMTTVQLSKIMMTMLKIFDE